MNQDFVDLLRALVDAEVRFLVVGAYALALHGHAAQATSTCGSMQRRRMPPEAWPDRMRHQFGDVDVDCIGREPFIRNKRATGRPRDLADIDGLE